MNDQIQRFIFDNADIRGELVYLETSYQETLSQHDYSEPVAKWLGDFLSAAVLLSQTIKFDGILTLQARSEGEIPLMMAEATSQGHVRAIARGADAATSDDFQTAFKNGYLSITIAPTKGKPYQGIVPLDGANLSECLEHYFAQSEQLATRIILASDSVKTAGLLLQELPAVEEGGDNERQQKWQHVTYLASTLKDEELLTLEFEPLLHRLYHQEELRLFNPSKLSFQCSCSEQRTMDVIRGLGREEAESIIEEQGDISIQCEFCHHKYRFAQASLAAIFKHRVH